MGYSSDGVFLFASEKKSIVLIYSVIDQVFLAKYDIKDHINYLNFEIREFGKKLVIKKKNQFTRSIYSSPKDRSWCLATICGVYIYDYDKITPNLSTEQNILPEIFLKNSHINNILSTLLIALRKNDTHIIYNSIMRISIEDIPSICKALPLTVIPTILNNLFEKVVTSPYLEHILNWVQYLVAIKVNGNESFYDNFTTQTIHISHEILQFIDVLRYLCKENIFKLRYFFS